MTSRGRNRTQGDDVAGGEAICRSGRVLSFALNPVAHGGEGLTRSTAGGLQEERVEEKAMR
jgi:hypothetical protein